MVVTKEAPITAVEYALTATPEALRELADIRERHTKGEITAAQQYEQASKVVNPELMFLYLHPEVIEDAIWRAKHDRDESHLPH
jgi:hypothetical protein